MPKWGLSPALREAGPWGLDPEWLEPGKQITDPVHGDIFLTRLETELTDSPPVQRLRRVQQLGMTDLVYPGATHTRFSHSLGALRVAQDLIDVVLDQRSGPGPRPDLFDEWMEDGETMFRRRVAEATVLARLGALLHDLCHVPFGHSIEDDLGILTSHDKNEPRFKRLWGEIPRELRNVIDGELFDNLRPLILSGLKSSEGGPALYPFVGDIVGNTICADLLDYLRRDHMYTGLPLALGRRFEVGFYVLPTGDPDFGSRMVLRITRADGSERVDAVTELLKHLRYRYELSERALVHHAKLAADAMVGKALEIWFDALCVERLVDRLGLTGEVSRDPEPLFDALKGESGAGAVRSLRISCQRELETFLLEHGDHGLLEFMTELEHEDVPRSFRDRKRRRAVASLARALLDRRLYKQIGAESEIREPKRDFYKRHGAPEARRTLERGAARFGGIDPAWQILIWLPSPTMRLKVAEVLVDDGHEIKPFVERERERRGRGQEIYSDHEHLWSVRVYVAPGLFESQRADRALAHLAWRLRVRFGRLADLGARVYEWPQELAVRALRNRRRRHHFSESDGKGLIKLRRARVARGQQEDLPPEFDALVREFGELARSEGI